MFFVCIIQLRSDVIIKGTWLHRRLFFGDLVLPPSKSVNKGSEYALQCA